jgi:hypothetical protein
MDARLLLEPKCAVGPFGLDPLRAGFRPLSRRKGRVGVRPSKASKAAICYVRPTSTPDCRWLTDLCPLPPTKPVRLLASHLLRRLVLAETDINRMSQKVVGGPGLVDAREGVR